MREQWQPKLGSPGERVTGVQELAQSLSMLIVTPLGSVPGRPLYGSRVFELISAPVDEVSARAPAYVREAVMANLPRLEVAATRAQLLSLGGVGLEIDWAPVHDPAAMQTTSVEVT